MIPIVVTAHAAKRTRASITKMTHETKANIDKLNKKLLNRVELFCKKVVEPYIKRHVPATTAQTRYTPGRPPGRLRRNIVAKVDKRERYRLVVRIYAGYKRRVPYAMAVEEGVKKKYWIAAREAGGMLRFKIGGKLIFTPIVTHPPMPGYGYMAKGMIVLMKWLPKILEGEVRDFRPLIRAAR